MDGPPRNDDVDRSETFAREQQRCTIKRHISIAVFTPCYAICLSPGPTNPVILYSYTQSPRLP